MYRGDDYSQRDHDGVKPGGVVGGMRGVRVGRMSQDVPNEDVRGNDPQPVVREAYTI